MAQTKLGTDVVHTIGNLPVAGAPAPAFTLTDTSLKDVTLGDFSGKNIILNIFPSIDTSVCAASVREFNKRAALLDNTVVLCVSKDLPFAMKRFCGAEGIDKVITLSDFRHPDFGKSYGVEMIDGGLKGMYARAIILINEQSNVYYTELVPVIAQEPDYVAALNAIHFLSKTDR
jgi:thiol peroxidase